MNKVLSTDHRVFICICGSLESGKTNLILDILSQNKETGGFLIRVSTKSFTITNTGNPFTAYLTKLFHANYSSKNARPSIQQ